MPPLCDPDYKFIANSIVAVEMFVLFLRQNYCVAVAIIIVYPHLSFSRPAIAIDRNSGGRNHRTSNLTSGITVNNQVPLFESACKALILCKYWLGCDGGATLPFQLRFHLQQ